MTNSFSDHLHTLGAGYTLHEYAVESVLGAGGFGITYLARDSVLNMPVAIKEYLPNGLAVRLGDSTVHAKSAADEGAYRWGLDRFLAEARTLARFRHPNIVRVLRFFEGNGTAYMVMEYEAGQSLAASIQAKADAVSEEFLLGMLLPLLDGLKRVHEQGFMHRDIKPTNIFIRRDESPVLLDFGSARLAIADKTQNLTTIYTPGYAPFEQYFSDGRQGPWTDIYSLGAVLYWCVTGVKPVEAASRVRKDSMVPAAIAGKGLFGAPFLAAIDAALSVNEEDRPQTIEAWERLIQGTAAELPPAAASPALRTAPATLATDQSAACRARPEVPRSGPQSNDMAGPGTRHQGVASTRPAPPRREPALGPAVRISYDEPAPAGRAIKGLLGLIVVGMIVMALGDRILAWRRPAGQGPAMQGRSVDAGARNRDNFPAAPAGGAEGQALELRQLDAPRLPAPVDTPAAELPAAERPGAGDRLPRLSEAIQACEGKGFGAPCGVSGRNNEILSGKCAPLPPGVGSAAAATRPGVDGQSLVCRPERFAAGSGDPSRRPGGPRPPIGGTQ